RGRSVRYFFIRSQLTRCCQSNPAMPKFAVPMVSPELKPRGFAVDENSSRLFPIAEDHIAASPSGCLGPPATSGNVRLARENTCNLAILLIVKHPASADIIR